MSTDIMLMRRVLIDVGLQKIKKSRDSTHHMDFGSQRLG
jgi:hypothetical protein